MSFTRLLLSGLCLCGLAAASQAEPVHLKLRPGLWQMSSSGETHGAPAIPAEMLARLPPAQRARIKAAMAASMANAGKPHVYKYCVTEKSLQHGFNPAEHSAQERCKPTILSSSGSTMDVRAECTGRRGGEHVDGRFHYEAPNPQTMNATIDMTMTERGHNVRIKRVMHGKWLSADCGKYARTGE